jgi:hypothetical protein
MGNSSFHENEGIRKGGMRMNIGRGIRKTRRLTLVVLGIIFVLSSCGGDGGSAGGGIGGTGSIVSQGIMTKGSIKLNDRTYDASGAAIRKDDTPATEAELGDGMKVTLRGQLTGGGLTGTALQVEAEDEVQGRVVNLNAGGTPPSFEVLKQTVVTDGRTVFANFSGPDPDDIFDMADDQFVEVHGLRDTANRVRATRVELKATAADPDPEDVELKGQVSGLAGTTFFIGAQEVSFNPSDVEPPGAVIGNSDFVEVEGTLAGDVLVASRVEREDLEDAEFEPDEGEDVEVEGFVTAFTVHPGDFLVDNVPVRTLATTEFEGGSALDLRNDVRVEAEGHFFGGVLIAEKIEFKDARVRINAEATAVSATSITLLGLDVQINDLTELDATLPLTSGLFYEIEGFQDSGGTIVSEEIDDGRDDRNILQAKVVTKDDVGKTITLLETPWRTLVDLNSVTTFEADDDTTLPDVNAFLALITPGQTVVKVRDDDLDGDWDQAELED